MLLERLVLDPEFKAAMAEDPKGALAGYQLDGDERAMLMAGIAEAGGTDSRVEERTSKASMAGLFSMVTEAFAGAGVGGGGIGVGGGPVVEPGSAPGPSGGPVAAD